MTAYATSEELRVWLGLTTIDSARATAVLAAASAEVDGALGQVLTRVEADVITVDGTGAPELVLPAWPVTAVATVVESRRHQEDKALTVRGDFDWSASGVLRRYGFMWWPCEPRSVTVTYDHGYETVPEQVETSVLRIAAAWWNNPRGLNSETLGDYSYRVTASPDAVVESELARVRQFAAR